MSKSYFELRTQSARGTDSMAADMMRHLHTRQYLGKVLVISDDPFAILSIARKQWLRVARAVQKQRASTLNADKILKYTRTITHMHHLRFTLKTPEEFPIGDVFFLKPGELANIPAQCFTVYCCTPLASDSAGDLLAGLPSEALVVDYCHETPWAELGAQPKTVLETSLHDAWEQAKHFLKERHIALAELQHGSVQDIDAMADALDTLLGASHPFMQVANSFQRALELARPIRLSKEQREQFDVLTLLAHRVQALSPGAFTQQFLEVYNEDDSLFLFGLLEEMDIETRFVRKVMWHREAGRQRLASALETIWSASRHPARAQRLMML